MSLVKSIHVIHGLEGSPNGAKVRALSEEFDVCCLAMDTSDFEGCVQLHAEALEHTSPSVLVGSSFGGAVAMELVSRGLWKGPSLLLAPAWKKYGAGANFHGTTVHVVHGTEDNVVPVEDSEELQGVRLNKRRDDHRLGLYTEQLLVFHVGWLANRFEK